ncbi:HD family hydrolase [Escherichia coli]|nr:HD family hydrolase [Escherichia coli]OOH57773.1 hypothetical protein BMT64_22800 [Escherichia coli]
MSFIKTFSGKHFYYDRINKDDIDINDIAVSLSNICRFAGHLSHFYSVAQHAVLCSQLVPQEFAFEALMHDATEAYCQDIPAPLKRLLPDYKRMEEKIDAVIREKYGLPPVMSTPVKYADLIMLATVFNYIECDYNRWRRHSWCGGLSPEQFENQNLA